MPHKDNDNVKQGEASPSNMIGKSNIPTSPMQSSTSGSKDETLLHNAVATVASTTVSKQQPSADTTATCTVTPSPAVLVTAAAAAAKEKELPTPRNLSYNSKASIPTSPVTLPRKEGNEEKKEEEKDVSNNKSLMTIAGPPLIVRHAHAPPAMAAYPYYPPPHYYAAHTAHAASLYYPPPYGYMPAPYSLASAPTAPPSNPFAPMSPIATKRKAATTNTDAIESPPRKHFRLMRQEKEQKDDKETSQGQQQQTVCVPLEDPLQHWKQMMAHPDRHADTLLPDFGQLVNYPHFLGHVSRSKNRPVPGTQASQQQQPPAGHKGCVMCGVWRRSAASALGMDGMSTATSDILIPRQNKGVCTACDVVVWKLKDDNDSNSTTTTPTTFKWCKGCKNFKAWAAFGRKSNATKCEKCRTRQKQKYAQKKQYMNSTPNTMEAGAVQGLQSLWAASSSATTASTSS